MGSITHHRNISTFVILFNEMFLSVFSRSVMEGECDIDFDGHLSAR